MDKIYVIIDGVRHEVKKDIQLIMENVFPNSGPEQVDYRLWVDADGKVILDWIEDDQCVLSIPEKCVGSDPSMPVEDFVDLLFCKKD